MDELTGLVYATALMRPERMAGMSVKSVKKKWSSKSFAAGVNREVIEKGAQMADVTKEHLAYHVGDEQIEWTGRADGIEDAQFSFSDMKPIMQALEVATHEDR